MSTYYRAAIMVGLPQCDVYYDEDEYEYLFDFLEYNDMEICEPFYDGADASYAIAGFIYKLTGSYNSLKVVWDQEEIDKLKAQFKKATGQDAEIYLSTWGY